MPPPPPRQTSGRDAFFRELRLNMMAAQEDFALREVVNIKGLIGTPFPPASQPGTPPHVRTGELQAGVDQETSGTDTGVVTVIYSDRPPGETDENVPVALEFGTPTVRKRPYMRVSLDDVRRNGANEIAKVLRVLSR